MRCRTHSGKMPQPVSLFVVFTTTALITNTARASTAPDATPARTMANARCCAQQGLTLERTPSGWIQRAAFTHPDLHDDLVEELVPLSSPFSSMCVRGSSAFTFLLLGDQNAGKSTFLHAFSHTGDATWLEIGSYLPIISASFVNASLCMDSTAPPMDEPPFLDTDIGRASLLLSLEDFAFFVSEFGLEASVHLESLAAQRVEHVALQLLEVGGALQPLVISPATLCDPPCSPM